MLPEIVCGDIAARKWLAHGYEWLTRHCGKRVHILRPKLPPKDNSMIEKAGFLQQHGWFGTF
jgi:hypothetical protein